MVENAREGVFLCPEGCLPRWRRDGAAIGSGRYGAVMLVPALFSLAVGGVLLALGYGQYVELDRIAWSRWLLGGLFFTAGLWGVFAWMSPKSQAKRHAQAEERYQQSPERQRRWEELKRKMDER